MRLTLRTLLSYLDDTLEPAQAKLIGQKVAESDVARELIDRIKQVTQQKRLAAPPPGQAGKIDPNAVAEYLDSVLPPDMLAEVEDLFLKSDVHLAEVAACHQILTLFLGQPAQVPPTALQRMYALSRGRDVLRQQPAAMPGDTEPPGASKESGVWGMSLGSHSSWIKRFAPIAGGLALLVALGLTLFMVLRTPEGPQARLGKPKTSEPEGTTGKDSTASTDGTKPKDAAGKTKDSPEKPKDGAEKPKDAAAKPKDGAEKPKDGDKPKDGGKKPEPMPPPDNAPMPEPQPEPVPPVVDIETPKVNKPSTEVKEVGTYAGAPKGWPTVVLHQAGGKWQPVKSKGRISTAELLVSLPGNRSDLKLDAGVQLTLWGNLPVFWPINVGMMLESAVTLNAPPAGFEADCTLDRGRVVLTNQKPNGTAKVRVRFHEEIWDLVLKEKAVVALELFGTYPIGTPFQNKPEADKPQAFVYLFVLAGDATLEVGYPHNNISLPASSLFGWDSYGPKTRGPLPSQIKLKWYSEQPPPKTKDTQELLGALDQFNARLAKKPLEILLAEARNDARPPSRYVDVMAMGAVDDIGGLIESLNDAKHADVRASAVDALRHWIGRNGEQDQKLYRFLLEKASMTPQHAEIAMSLLHSFSIQQARSPETYEVLIDYLRSDKLAIRELAYFHLYRLTPEKLRVPFNAASEPALRTKAIAQWEKLVKEHKIPSSGPPAPGI